MSLLRPCVLRSALHIFVDLARCLLSCHFLISTKIKSSISSSPIISPDSVSMSPYLANAEDISRYSVELMTNELEI